MNAVSSRAAGVVSMTGFARAGDVTGEHGWTWEIRGVNARGLDVRLRLPPGLDQLEPTVREAVARGCARGTINVTLDLKRSRAGAGFRINRPALDQLLALQAELGPRVDQAPPRLEALLGVRGLFEEAAEPESAPGDDATLRTALLAGFERVLAAFDSSRRAEGARLADIVGGHVETIATLAADASAAAAQQPGLLAERLKRQVAGLLEERIGVAPDRLAAEIALLASRADVTEELDRLRAHVASARDLIAGGGAIGRKLDFLAQEFNREANTLTSKSADIAVTNCGLALKTAIDQFREQVQNIE
jgi:uncharacterized protein (TIGR00255 family)